MGEYGPEHPDDAPKPKAKEGEEKPAPVDWETWWKFKMLTNIPGLRDGGKSAPKAPEKGRVGALKPDERELTPEQYNELHVLEERVRTAQDSGDLTQIAAAGHEVVKFFSMQDVPSDAQFTLVERIENPDTRQTILRVTFRIPGTPQLGPTDYRTATYPTLKKRS